MSDLDHLIYDGMGQSDKDGIVTGSTRPRVTVDAVYHCVINGQQYQFPCKYQASHQWVDEIQTNGISLDVVTEEYVELSDGTQLREPAILIDHAEDER